jgi:hypothetical protein
MKTKYKIKVTLTDGKYSADALWLCGAPPVARGWSSQELAIAVLREMVMNDSTMWGEWPELYAVKVNCG